MERVSYQHAKEDCHDPSSDKSFDSLLGGQLDQRSLAPEESKDVGPNVVGNHQGGRQEEPDQTLKDVVDDEVTLADDKQEGHVGPSKLRELEAIMTLLQIGDKEHKACIHLTRRQKHSLHSVAMVCPH